METTPNQLPTSGSIKVPETLEDFNASWLSTVTGLKISPENFQVTPNIQGGMGFLSSIQRISCHDLENDNQLSLIVKILPNGESEFEQWTKQVAIAHGLDVTEILFYNTIRPDVVKELPDLERYFCKFYKGHVIEEPRNSVIILEDLKPLGYSSRSFDEELTPTQIQDAVKFMAKFHVAGSAIAMKKQKSLHELYPGVRDRREEMPALVEIIKDGYSKLDDFFQEQKCSQEFRDYFSQLQGDHQEQIFEAVYRLAFNPITLIHGDLWSNNIMVTDEDDKAEGKSSIKVIDWQMLSAGDPVVDLAILILSVLPPSELKKVNARSLVKLYFDTHVETCKSNGLDIARGDYDCLLKEFETYGLAYAFIWFTFARDPFNASFPRLVKIYEFLRQEADIMSYLLTLA